LTAKIVALRNQPPRSQEMVARSVSRHEAVRRVIAAARANGLGAGAVTEKNIAIVAEFNLFPEYGSFGYRVPTVSRIPSGVRFIAFPLPRSK
jgi:hypothetical protein